MRLATRSQVNVAVARAAVRARAQPPQVTTLPSPIGGWNARDAWSDMDASDAIELDNWWPGFGKCERRGGTSAYASLDTAGDVDTVAELKLAAGSKLIAAAGGALWDASAGGVIPSSLATGFGNDRWQTASMNDTLGLVNGTDAPRVYDGSSVSAMTVSGPTIANLNGLNVYKSRSYFWTGADQSFWYSDVNAFGGSLTEFPLGRVGTFGGALVAMYTWTRDGGAGMDDLAVFQMSSGETIVYSGSDPGDADDWALVGVFRMGSPLGVRASAKIGGDLLVATSDGYSLLSKALPGGRSARAAQISDKIVNAAVQAATAGSGSFGWDILFYPRGQRAMINVPVPSNNTWHQHVVNIATGAWCRFRGMPARCWTLYDDAPYFGGATGTVYLADTGHTDAGAQIVASGRQAFSYLGSKSRNKQVSMIGPLIEADEAIGLTLGLASDFAADPNATVQVTLSPASSGSDWDTADWDTATWGASATVVQEWMAHSARGYAISPSVRLDSSSGAVSWNATRFGYQPASVI